MRLAQGERIGCVAKDAHRLARSGDLRLTARRVDILLTQDAVDLACGHAKRLHLGRVKNDTNFTVYAAIAANRRHAFDRQQPPCDGVVDKPAELFQRHIAGFNREVGDRVAGCCDLENLRFQNAIGQIAADLVDSIFDFADRSVDVVANFEFGADRRVAFA